MGAFSAKLGLSSTQLIHSGWLTASEHQRVTGSGTFTLRPLYGPQDGLRALEVPLGQDRLVLEYRRPENGLDEGLDGVYAYHVTGTSYRSAAPISWSNAGRDGAVTRFTDTAHKLTVSVTSKDASGATVTVSTNGVPAPATTVSAAPVPPASGSATVSPGAGIPTHGDSEPPADGTPTTDPGAGDPSRPPTSPGKGTENGDGTGLAATGSDTSTAVLAVVGATLLLLGGVFMVGLARRGRAGR